MSVKNELYSDFKEYCQQSFREDLKRLFASYCEATQNDTVFLGFHKDELVHIDTIHTRIHKDKIVFPKKEDIAKFALAVFSVAVSDITVYCFYPAFKEEWERITRCPKFTGWNYCADRPNYLFKLMESVYPDADVHTEISRMISAFGEEMTNEIANDIAAVLSLGSSEVERIRRFVRSWLCNDTLREGEPFDIECFLK